MGKVNKIILSITIVIVILSLLGTGLFLLLPKEAEISQNEENIIVEREEIKEEELNNSIIKNLFLEKYPKWKKDDFNIEIEEQILKHARGTINWNTNRHKSFWFATKIDNAWIITDYLGSSYFGICQNFKKYNFPSEMIPDCWDNEKKIMLNTKNIDKFYNGLTIEDKDEIKQVFLVFGKYLDDSYYQDKKLFIKFNDILDNYLRGSVLIGEKDNHSAPHFFAVKEGGGWKILYYGQESPYCKDIEGYNFPTTIIPKCFTENGQKLLNR